MKIILETIETSNGTEWGCRFIDYPSIVGGCDTPEEALEDGFVNLYILQEYLGEE